MWNIIFPQVIASRLPLDQKPPTHAYLYGSTNQQIGGRRPVISVQGLNKSFKVAKRTTGLVQATKSLFVREHTEVHALTDISFNIQPGEIVGYIGPNGA